MSIGMMAAQVGSVLQSEKTAEDVREWVMDKLRGIREDEERGAREFVEKLGFTLPLQTADGELREVKIVVQVGDKQHKVQPATAREQAPTSRGDVPDGQLSFLALDGPKPPTMDYTVDEAGLVDLDAEEDEDAR